MAYDNLVGSETGLSIGTIKDGKIIDTVGVEVGSVRDGVAHGMSSERWGFLSDARAGEGPSPTTEAMRQALGLK